MFYVLVYVSHEFVSNANFYVLAKCETIMSRATLCKMTALKWIYFSGLHRSSLFSTLL